MRGKVSFFLISYLDIRITPAHAGKSSADKICSGFCTDHPRTCGEKRGYGGRLQTFLGSPPHMRGKVITDGIITGEYGITPAHAGKR